MPVSAPPPESCILGELKYGASFAVESNLENEVLKREWQCADNIYVCGAEAARVEAEG
jgi:hypothetical protein